MVKTTILVEMTLFRTGFLFLRDQNGPLVHIGPFCLKRSVLGHLGPPTALWPLLTNSRERKPLRRRVLWSIAFCCAHAIMEVFQPSVFHYFHAAEPRGSKDCFSFCICRDPHRPVSPLLDGAGTTPIPIK